MNLERQINTNKDHRMILRLVCSRLFCFERLAIKPIMRNGRIGNQKALFALYGTIGKVLKERFSGWRVGIVTSDRKLAFATGIKFDHIGPPIPHGGLKIALYQTHPLP